MKFYILILLEIGKYDMIKLSARNIFWYIICLLFPQRRRIIFYQNIDVNYVSMIRIILCSHNDSLVNNSTVLSVIFDHAFDICVYYAWEYFSIWSLVHVSWWQLWHIYLLSYIYIYICKTISSLFQKNDLVFLLRSNSW